ncbi:AfsR/SARP family transcriptional regulator [Streptomyces sp. NBC_01283]|uniref:AfsR/SARP family transcriptional regulator n=1 Tax=Streptomyces sp. NBC_01283 TaxID=2903812 RepID=UPI00352FD191|nr:AfsR/SARP family transcriptional regulator [Streptomyces sp. NBC_01283]WSL21321.1 AfsR/SARP family transcriptional regulator [Streptomyces sp. NBC_01283]
MDIEVLGGFTVRLNGMQVVPTAPKPRQVLALLALNAGRAVPTRTLAEELWGAQPPRSSRATLQTYILQLRELIGEALIGVDGLRSEGRTGKDLLVTSPGGYRLETGGGTRDYSEFARLSNEGYRAMDNEDYAGAARTLRDALALWQGPALADVNAGSHLDMETRRLEEARLCALDQRIEADLCLGRYRELLPELTVLVERHSMHESLHSQFMLALYRSGRGGDALNVYQRLRGTLVRNLGLEPSAPVRRLQRSILKASSDITQDALLDGRTAPAPVS